MSWSYQAPQGLLGSGATTQDELLLEAPCDFCVFSQNIDSHTEFSMEAE